MNWWTTYTCDLFIVLVCVEEATFLVSADHRRRVRLCSINSREQHCFSFSSRRVALLKQESSIYLSILPLRCSETCQFDFPDFFLFFIYMYTYIYIYIYIYICVYVCVCVCVCTWLCVSVWVCLCMCVCVCVREREREREREERE